MAMQQRRTTQSRHPSGTAPSPTTTPEEFSQTHGGKRTITKILVANNGIAGIQGDQIIVVISGENAFIVKSTVHNGIAGTM